MKDISQNGFLWPYESFEMLLTAGCTPQRLIRRRLRNIMGSHFFGFGKH
jgi:hypothetical protein